MASSAAKAAAAVVDVHSAENVRVFIRARPLNPKELDAKCQPIVKMDKKMGTVELVPPKYERAEQQVWTFDGVFNDDSTQQEVYNAGAAHIVESVLGGYNGTIFAYGQTSAGKTHTMMGVLGDPEKQGIVPHSIQHIFHHIAKATDHEYLVRIAYMEIYCEVIRDLLNPRDHKLQLRLNPGKGYTVEGLTDVVVHTPGEIHDYMRMGNGNRHVGETAMNKESSRSHSIFQIIVEGTEKKEALGGGKRIKTGKLNLVDLAGSERQKKTKAEGQRLAEANKINLSLMALGNVINALVKGKSTHIPYRDSKLTQLLEDSLGGNTKTTMFANISPADSNYDETKSTLKYADRAKQIKNKPKVNEDEKDALLAKMQDEIARLKAELEGSGMAAAGSDTAKMQEMAGKSGVETELLMRLRFETEAEAALAKCNIAQAERERIFDGLRKMQAEDEQERKAKDDIKKQLRTLESSICVGGVNLLDENERQKAELLETQQELIRHQEEKKAAEKRLAEEEEARLFKEETYKTIEEEIRKKTDKAKRLWARCEGVRGELAQINADIEKERQELVETIKDLESEMSMQDLIIEQFVPQNEARIIRESAHWDDAEDDWLIMGLSLAGNLVVHDWEGDDDDDMLVDRHSVIPQPQAPAWSQALAGVDNVYFTLGDSTPAPGEYVSDYEEPRRRSMAGSSPKPQSSPMRAVPSRSGSKAASPAPAGRKATAWG
eukprot:m51a1_g13800 putative kinesin-like protein kif3b (719) ;mRNA; f:360626-363315